MYFIILILSIFAFVKTIGYAIFEYTDNSNKVAGIVIGILSIIALIRAYYYNYDKIEQSSSVPFVHADLSFDPKGEKAQR